MCGVESGNGRGDECCAFTVKRVRSMRVLDGVQIQNIGFTCWRSSYHRQWCFGVLSRRFCRAHILLCESSPLPFRSITSFFVLAHSVPRSRALFDVDFSPFFRSLFSVKCFLPYFPSFFSSWFSFLSGSSAFFGRSVSLFFYLLFDFVGWKSPSSFVRHAPKCHRRQRCYIFGIWRKRNDTIHKWAGKKVKMTTKKYEEKLSRWTMTIFFFFWLSFIFFFFSAQRGLFLIQPAIAEFRSAVIFRDFLRRKIRKRIYWEFFADVIVLPANTHFNYITLRSSYTLPRSSPSIQFLLAQQSVYL